MNRVRPGPVSKGLPACAPGKDGRGALGLVAADQLFDAYRQADLGLAGQHVLASAVEGEGGGGAAAFDIDHRHPLGEQPFFDQRREGHLAADAALPPLAHAAVAEPGLFDQPRAVAAEAAIEQQIGIGPAGQVGEGLVLVLAEGRARGGNDIDLAHGVALHEVRTRSIGEAAPAIGVKLLAASMLRKHP